MSFFQAHTITHIHLPLIEEWYHVMLSNRRLHFVSLFDQDFRRHIFISCSEASFWTCVNYQVCVLKFAAMVDMNCEYSTCSFKTQNLEWLLINHDAHGLDVQVCSGCGVFFPQVILHADRATVWDDFIANVLTCKMQRAAATYLCISFSLQVDLLSALLLSNASCE